MNIMPETNQTTPNSVASATVNEFATDVEHDDDGCTTCKPRTAEHRHVGRSGGWGPGQNSAECACGTVFDGFDTHAEAKAELDAHIASERSRTPQIPIADLRQFARRAEQLGFAVNPDGDPSYLVERINALLAEGVEPTRPESEWEPFPACPSWCTGVHVDDGQFRDCQSEETFVPRYRDGVVCVDVVTTFNRATGVATPALVRVEDYEFNPQYARHLAMLLVRAADLVEADER